MVGPGGDYFVTRFLQSLNKAYTYIRDCTNTTISLVRCGSSVVGAPVRNLGKFVYPTLPSLSDETLQAIGPFYLESCSYVLTLEWVVWSISKNMSHRSTCVSMSSSFLMDYAHH